MSSGSESRRLVDDSSQTARYVATTSATPQIKQQDDATFAMLDPQSLSPAKKRLFVCGMVLASFLASLDLTGEYPGTTTIGWI